MSKFPLPLLPALRMPKNCARRGLSYWMRSGLEIYFSVDWPRADPSLWSLGRSSCLRKRWARFSVGAITSRTVRYGGENRRSPLMVDTFATVAELAESVVAVLMLPKAKAPSIRDDESQKCWARAGQGRTATGREPAGHSLSRNPKGGCRSARAVKRPEDVRSRT